MSLSSRLGRLSTTRIVVLFAIATMLPLATLAYMSVTLGDHGLRSEAERRLSGVAVAGGKFTNEETSGIAGVVESFAGRSTVSDALASGPGRYDVKALGVQLNDLKAARAGTSVTFVTDVDGRLIAGRPDNPANVGQDFSFRDWYRGVKQTGNTYVSDAFVSAAPGAPEVISVATPVRNASGQTIGYIGANYGLDALQALMKDFASSQEVSITVVDKQGVIVATPDVLPKELTSLKSDPHVAAALAGKNDVIETTRNGHHVIAAYAPAQASGWAVIAEVPAASALAPVSSLRVTVLTSAALLGLVVIAGLTLLVISLRERERIESALRGKERETRAILNAATDAYITMDSGGRITTWSDQAENTFGWSKDEVVGRQVADVLIPEEFREGHKAGLQRYLQTGEGPILDTRIEVEALHRDGRRFPLELAVWAVQGEKAVVFNAFCHDITERRRASDELAEARDKALEASRLKSEFVANMSHEIRTPMNGVLGMTSLLLHTDLTPEQKEYTETVNHSAEALLDVINDILDFSKIEAGRMEIEHVAFDLRTVVEGASELLAGAAQAKGLELTVSIADDIATFVYGDPVRLRQVLLNFVGNAVKFTEVGEVAIQASLVENFDNRQLVRFEIVDTGIGIREADKHRLFQSFSQVDTSSSRVHGGTGLGLVISKQLVELMDGEVGFVSSEGKGSTFWFTVSLDSAESEDDSSLVPSRSSTPSASLAGLRVLVVDDNATNRRILHGTLAKWNIESSLAASGPEALRVLTEAAEQGVPFDLALIDYNMPGMDGIELGSQIVADPRIIDVKRILLTSSGERGDAQSAANGGFVAYLTKPIREAALSAHIAKAVSDRKSSVDLREADAAAPAETKTSSRPRVLMAEDNLVNQNVTRHMLQKMGYDVVVVSDGGEAVEALSNSSFAAVLMDCQMPKVDGYQATRDWRAREPEGKHVPIIAITAHAMRGDAEKCFEAGMDGYLAKPVAWEDLEATMRYWAPLNTSENHGTGGLT